MKVYKGFTLIEMMVVLVIIAILLAFALPSYEKYRLKKDLAIAQQEALYISNELERFKAKNFSYKGFDATYLYANYNVTNGELLLPPGTTSANAKFKLTLADGSKKPLTIFRESDGKETNASQEVLGLTWLMKVERITGTDNLPKQPQNYDLLLNSSGLRCMTRTQSAVREFVSCGTTDVETW